MLVTIVLVVVLGAAAVAVAAVANRRRRPDAPSTPSFAAPQQLDRGDFADAELPWLLVLFSSATCMSCQEAREVVTPLDVDGLAVQEVQFPDDRALHDRYRVESVPTVVMADAEGVVVWSYVGAPPSMAMVELLVDLGLVADPHDHGDHDHGDHDHGTAVDLPGDR